MNIQNHFPVLLRTEQVIQKRVEKVRDEEKNKRQDLHAIATSYLGILKQKCSQLIPESEFHQVSEKTLELEKAALNGDASLAAFLNGKNYLGVEIVYCYWVINRCSLYPISYGYQHARRFVF